MKFASALAAMLMVTDSNVVDAMDMKMPGPASIKKSVSEKIWDKYDVKWTYWTQLTADDVPSLMATYGFKTPDAFGGNSDIRMCAAFETK